MRIDHVILACAGSLDSAGERLRRETGIATQPGGSHPGLGTANRLVPLAGGAYLELAGIVDDAAAAQASFGRLVTEAARGSGDRAVPAAWCVKVRDIDAHARRLGLQPVSMARTRPDGVELHWRLAGVERSLEDPSLPFLISWDVPPGEHPGALPATGPEVSLVEVRLTGDPARLEQWLDGGLDRTTVVVERGRPRVRAVVLDVAGRTVVLTAPRAA